MMIGKMTALGALALAAGSVAAAQAARFEPGTRFTAVSGVVQAYSPAGQSLGSITLPSYGCGSDTMGESRGIAFGPQGYLYAVRSNNFVGSGTGQPCVQVVDRTGALVKSYPFSAWIGGLVTSGSIHFSPDKSTFYVSALDGVFRFDVDGTSGTSLSPSIGGSVDLAVMPDGNLLVSDGSSLARYTAAGVQVGPRVTMLSDPYGLATGAPILMLNDVRGVAYDAATNTTFVTMLGYSDFFFQLLALDGSSNRIKGLTSYWYGSEIRRTVDGHLVVGSWTQAPGVFTYTDGRPGSFRLEGQLGSASAVFTSSWNKKP